MLLLSLLRAPVVHMMESDSRGLTLFTETCSSLRCTLSERPNLSLRTAEARLVCNEQAGCADLKLPRVVYFSVRVAWRTLFRVLRWVLRTPM